MSRNNSGPQKGQQRTRTRKPDSEKNAKRTSTRLGEGASPKTSEGHSSGNARDLQIGARVRHARILKGMLVRELAAAVGCTESTISKIENDRILPSIPMMQNLITALDRDMASFFGLNPARQSIVQRARERPVTETDPIRRGKGIKYERLVPFAAGNLLEANIHVIEPGGERTDDISNQGEALGLLLEGQIELVVDGTTHTVNAGDSFFFKAHLSSSYRNITTSVARLLWVNTPQVH